MVCKYSLCWTGRKGWHQGQQVNMNYPQQTLGGAHGCLHILDLFSLFHLFTGIKIPEFHWAFTHFLMCKCFQKWKTLYFVCRIRSKVFSLQTSKPAICKLGRFFLCVSKIFEDITEQPSLSPKITDLRNQCDIFIEMMSFLDKRVLWLSNN